MGSAKAIARRPAGEPGATSRAMPRPLALKPIVAPSQPRPTDVAQTLQRVALDLFARQNYSTVTIKDIARETGFNSALIYYYFGSKEGLFLEVVEATIEEAFRQFETISENAKSPDEIISHWIETHITHFALMQKLGKISLDYASTHNRAPHIDQAVHRFYGKESIVLRRAIQSGIAQGVFRKVNIQETITFISTFLDGCLFRAVIFPKFNYRAAIRSMRRVAFKQLRA